MELPKKIKNEIWEYCRVNDITDIDGFIQKMVKQGFTIEKYGSSPYGNRPEPEIIEKIVEVEKIVEKEVFISDNKAIETLNTNISKLETTIEKLKLELEASKTKGEKLSTELSNYKGKIDGLEKELEAEKEKPKADKDIYGEDKKGFFGSNISDLWKANKKQ